MIYRATEGRASYGEAIGILLLDTYTPFIPGDVANATTYKFPVRFQKVPGFTVERAIAKDPSVFDALLTAARDLQSQGVRAVTGDCGYMIVHQQELSSHLAVPVFLSSLLQVPFISRIIGTHRKVGIICADSRQLDVALLKRLAGIDDSVQLAIAGMQDRPHFYRAILQETGTLDTQKIEEEIVAQARGMVAAEPAIGAFLLECSCLPPYGAAVQEAVGLPVFDYITMIEYVFHAVVKRKYNGFM